MANNYNSNPIFIDSVMAATAKNSGAATTNSFHIKEIVWSTPGTTASDAAVIQDGLGNEIFEQQSGRAAPELFNPPIVVDDFKVTTLADGHILIYLV